MRKKWAELDLFRGFAAIFMLLNHAGVGWLPPHIANGHSLSGMLTTLGSFAPVFFFFATGVGYGLQGALGSGARRSYGLLNKVVILILCDQFSAWHRGLAYHFDFLSFIAFSMLVLELPRRARRPIPIAISAIAIAFGLRFVVAPWVGTFVEDETALLWLARFLGRDSTPGFSYPLFPWVCYPFGGFVLGYIAQRSQSRLDEDARRVYAGLVGVAGLAFAAAWMLIANGHAANRWGTMSISFFSLSIGALAVGVLVSHGSMRVPMLARIMRPLCLGGMPSLTVVPLHFLFVAFFGLGLGIVTSEWVFVSASVLLIAIVLSASRFMARVGQALSSRPDERFVWGTLASLAATAGVCLALFPTAAFIVRLSIACAAQLCLCMLLVVRWSGRGGPAGNQS